MSLGHLGRSSDLKKLKNAEKVNSRKSVRWSAVPVAPMCVCGCEVVRGAAAPKGPMTYTVFIAAGM